LRSFFLYGIYIEDMKSILLTGFEPFGGSRLNPSIEACKKYDEKVFNDFKIRVVEIPLKYKEIRSFLIEAIEGNEPIAIICTGQAGSSTINLERVAINVADARIPYNCGTQPIDEPIVVNGPVAYFSSLPLRKILSALQNAKIPSTISNSAGTFGCNHIFYELMHYLSQKDLNIPAGFVHVPSLPEQVIGKNQPSMDLRLITEAIGVILESLTADL